MMKEEERWIYIGMLLTLAGIILSLNLVSAKQITNMKLSKDALDYLKDKNINNLTVKEYETSGATSRCFKVDGDLKDNLICMNTLVCDHYVRQVTYINRRPLKRIPIITMTSQCEYRSLSDNEVTDITLKALNVYIEGKVKKDKPTKSVIYPDLTIDVKDIKEK